jgi:hypothetical protein
MHFYLTAINRYLFNRATHSRSILAYLRRFWHFPSSTTTTPVLLENSRNCQKNLPFLHLFFWTVSGLAAQRD